MDPNHPNYSSWVQNSQNYPQSSEYPNSQNIPNFAYYQNPQIFSNPEYSQNTAFSPNLSQIPTSQENPISENITRNLLGEVQRRNKNQKGKTSICWSVKEDVVLMSSWIHASEDSIRGKKKKKESIWARVHNMYNECQADNPTEIHIRNIESMKCRWKRLNENANKWVAACREANTRRRSGMNDQDVENEAHSIYKACGSKFQDLHVFNEVMSKHPKWSIHDATHFVPVDEDTDAQQGGGSSKRSRTSETGEFSISSIRKLLHLEIRVFLALRVEKGKGKVTQSDSNEHAVAELRALRISKDNENEPVKSRLELDREKMEMSSLKMYQKMLIKLMDNPHLSLEDREMKNRLMEIVFGNK